MSVTFKLHGFGASLRNMRRVDKELFLRASRESLKSATTALAEDLKTNVSDKTYSLADLRRLGHPYARHHGSIRVHTSKPYIVHDQTGTMRSSITRRMKMKGRNWTGRVGFNYNKQAYFRYVIQGTRKMLPRDTVYRTSQQDTTRKKMMKAVVTVMGREFRTKATIRF
jgi:hypothetical protein